MVWGVAKARRDRSWQSALALLGGLGAAACGGSIGPTIDLGGARDASRASSAPGGANTPTAAVDPGVAACPWIAEHDYTHPSDAFFERSVVIRIDLTMSDADWQYQLANPDLEEYRPVTVAFCGEQATGAGMRFKRSTHPRSDLEEGYPKNPMVLDLNEFAPGGRLRGLRKINLEYGDDTMLVAERLNWELLADFGLNVSRANYARVFVNGDYVGVFTNVERVDRSFAQLHWGENDGQLFKHAYCGTFAWRGDEPADYTADPRCYSPEPSDEPGDFTGLLEVIDVLEHTADTDLEHVLPTVWNLDAWLPMVAALQALAYGDTPNANGNNFYTYYRFAGGPAEVALWDLDGGFFADGAPCEHPADLIGWDLFRISECYSYLPLFHRVVAVPAWRARYLTAVADFAAGPFTPASYEARVGELVDQLTGPLADDPNRVGDDAAWHAGVAALVASQAARHANVATQLSDW